MEQQVHLLEATQGWWSRRLITDQVSIITRFQFNFNVTLFKSNSLVKAIAEAQWVFKKKVYFSIIAEALPITVEERKCLNVDGCRWTFGEQTGRVKWVLTDDNVSADWSWWSQQNTHWRLTRAIKSEWHVSKRKPECKCEERKETEEQNRPRMKREWWGKQNSESFIPQIPNERDIHQGINSPLGLFSYFWGPNGPMAPREEWNTDTVYDIRGCAKPTCVPL